MKKTRKASPKDPEQKNKAEQSRSLAGALSNLSNPPSNTDPQGSYTGIPLDPKECPTQDADDL